MKSSFRKAVILLLVLAWLSLPGLSQKPGAPLSGQEVAELVKNFVPSERIVELVQKLGISFVPSDGYLRNLRKEGADDKLIEALRKAKSPKPGAKQAETTAQPETAKPAEPPKPTGTTRQRGPLSQEQLSTLLESGIPSDALSDLVGKLGINFEPTTTNLNDLRKSGAENELLQAVLRTKRYPPPAPTRQEPKKPVAKVTQAPSGPSLKPVETKKETAELKTAVAEPTTVKTEPQEKQEPVVQPPTKPAGPLTVGGEVSPPQPLYTPGAPYTEQARRAHLQGTVVLTIVIDENGQVTKLQEISKPLGMGLDASAFQTVGTWKFKPATFRGMPVQVRVNVNVNFHLQN
jgi:TonB family protein